MQNVKHLPKKSPMGLYIKKKKLLIQSIPVWGSSSGVNRFQVAKSHRKKTAVQLLWDSQPLRYWWEFCSWRKSCRLRWQQWRARGYRVSKMTLGAGGLWWLDSPSVLLALLLLKSNLKWLKSVKPDTIQGQHGTVHGNLARFGYSAESRETKNLSPIPLIFFFNLLWIEH